MDRQETQQTIERVFGRIDILEACQRDRRDMTAILSALSDEGLRYRVIAGLTGIAHSRLSEYGNGIRQPNLDMIEKFANGLNLPDAARIAFGLAPIGSDAETARRP